MLLARTGLSTAQQPVASPAAPQRQIIGVRTGSSCGWCTEGYNDNETIVERRWITTISRSYTNKRKFPEMKTRRPIKPRDWNDLIALIDTKMLADFNGPIGCPGCVDQPIGWAEVDFSDGAKKSVSYNLGSAPASVSALIRKIANVGMKSAQKAPVSESQSLR